ncbi:hypothetical protein FNV43_RR06954 [Rhamnella rubrinervis]|uniref:U1 small nuclear ribonucleoprotein C n=1 Tax=Rhamnella rubrinervis TaxID=2594499 RepID=A0A8K0HEG6_9ROSA|nr:hypothetical protein FNV43_RR06954 [Rhamnella rubrinervis]
MYSTDRACDEEDCELLVCSLLVPAHVQEERDLTPSPTKSPLSPNVSTATQKPTVFRVSPAHPSQPPADKPHALSWYYCDYCDTYLTHDSPSVRKQHNAGYKHKANVRIYYQQFEEQQTQSLIDQRIKEHLGQAAAFHQVGAAYNQHLLAQRPRLPVLPTPGMPQIPGTAPLLPAIRPPVLPRPVPGAPEINFREGNEKGFRVRVFDRGSLCFTATMEEITEGVNNINILDSQKKNRIQVSNTKKPLFFYVNLAKRYMEQFNEVELSALGMAIATVVTIAEILKNNGLAIEKKIMTSTVDIKDDSRGRPVQKAKIEILLGKTANFDELMAAALEERESGDAEEQS